MILTLMNDANHKIMPSSTRLSLDAAGQQLITGKARSKLPASGLSVTSDCANQWCRSVALYLRAQYRPASRERDHAARPLTFLMWPYRQLDEEDDSRQPLTTECLFVSVIYPGNEWATHITFTSSTFFSGALLSEDNRVDLIPCMVPDMVEALHLAGTLANQLGATIQMLGQDTDDNPMTLGPLLDEDGPWD